MLGRHEEDAMNDWILVVDDDTSNLKMASYILGGAQMRVSCLKAGGDAVRFLQENRPDLILLDVHMPGMDGFQTMQAIRENETAADIPVIFLTADDDSDTEKRGLELGAQDFIKKPFVPEVLLLRVRHTIDLSRLQADLEREVQKKTREIAAQHEKLERISMQIVKALSGAVDAKDTYTNGHSLRVAEYSREIAHRAGLSKEMQNDIYMTEEEYSVIKTHPVMGAGILKNIKDFPKLITGARWHHERYDGKGYPDGISGDEIPLEARIIAVADAYDAMSSRRSYRDVLPQEIVRSEIEKGKGTQFDPVMADIALGMIDDDTDYQMRER